jgi:hypothetical protein
MEVEVNIKIPTLTVRSATEADKRIDNSAVRFIKVIEVPVLPKPGSPLQLTTSSGENLECTVTRSDWNEEKSLFTLACRYSKRSISEGAYGALVNDSEWTMRQLL